MSMEKAGCGGPSGTYTGPVLPGDRDRTRKRLSIDRFRSSSPLSFPSRQTIHRLHVVERPYNDFLI